MKRVFFLIAGVLVIFAGCQNAQKRDTMTENPLLKDFDTRFQVPPFADIDTAHYLPAFKQAIQKHNDEIQTIAEQPAEPDFENTIAALDYSGMLLDKVSSVFFNMTSAHTNDQLQQIAREVSPMLSKHRDNIRLNRDLFARVKAVYDQRDELDLTTEQETLLDKTYENFVRGGANLPEEKRARFREINERMSVLTLNFGEHVLNETNEFKMFIDDEADLAGLPKSVRDAAAESAADAGKEGQWLFTIHKPSLIPFLQYSDKRGLREKMYKAYINQGDNGDENDNKELINEIVNLRIERAHLLGYDNHAEYVLEKNMAKKPENVYAQLEKIWKHALPAAKEEARRLQEMINESGENFDLKPWDWWYYAEKLKKAKYDLDESETRPYFQLENVRKGAFDVAGKLFGLEFTPLEKMPVYHEDVQVYEVTENGGEHVGVLYMDFHPRESKRGGAWMTSFQSQYKKDGKDNRPVIQVVTNFTKPTDDTPSLLSWDEATTLFHEFGHALHGLLSDCTYPAIAGTNVPRDFVELPSQIMENWAGEPKVMKQYAMHYETGDPIPDALIEKIKNAGNFNQGFETLEYLAAAFLDMDYHILEEKQELDVNAFEDKSMERIGMIPEIESRYRSTYFRHVFSGGYSAGYYSYNWAAVLDADAFNAFKENGLFDSETARAFRENILEKGGAGDPMENYKAFRGQEPKVDPLLERKGML